MTVYNKFNRGEIDGLALARDDVEKVSNSCSYMNNWMPIRLGPMQFRPGTEMIGEIDGGSYMIPFVGGIDDTAILVPSDESLKVWVDGEPVSRDDVDSEISNGEFTSDISSWTDSSGSGSVTAWETGGYASLTGTSITSAVLYQTVSVSSADEGAEHGINISVERSALTISIGTDGESSSDIYSGTLLPGVHSLLITPDSDFTITLSTSNDYATLVDSVTVASAGDISFDSVIAEDDLSTIRHRQSADVVFVTHDGGKMYRVERRGTKSWSLVDFVFTGGPFDTINTSSISMTAGDINGDTTLTASSSYFDSDHVGALFKTVSSSQTVVETVTAEDNGTNSIKVTGVDTSRQFTITIVGLTSTGTTATLQVSSDDSTWEEVATYTSNTSTTYDDGLDNSILYYRLYVSAGDYVAGSVGLTLYYSGGGIEGICRVTEYTSSTVVNVQVLEDFGSTDSTLDWYESQWSPYAGYPSSVSLYEGRLWLAGNTNLWGSESDAFSSFDGDIDGDSAAIYKTIGFGPVSTVHWLENSNRLLMGIATDEISVRSSSFGEVLTQDNANLKSGSNQGSAPIAPVRIDDEIYFVQRSLVKIMGLEYGVGTDNHTGKDLMTLNQGICSEGIKKIAVVRQPETRIYVVMDDGTARIYLIDKAEDVAAWSRFDTPGGVIEDIVTLPGLVEDEVYLTVERNGTHYLEKMARISEYEDRHFDSSVNYTSPGTATLTGLDHLNGETVGVWADGVAQDDATVSSGSITVSSDSFSDISVGLKYEADYISNKLGQSSSQEGGQQSRLGRRARILNLGIVAYKLYPDVLSYGPSLDDLDPMPDYEEDDDENEYDNTPFEFNGTHTTDSRIALKATGPCTISAIVYDVKD